MTTTIAPPQETLFCYDPPIDIETVRAWQADLDRVLQPTDALSRLVIRWESGDRWAPIQRFVIWQCLDPATSRLADGASAVPEFIMDELRGPNPRAMGHYCADKYCKCLVKRNRYTGGKARAI